MKKAITSLSLCALCALSSAQAQIVFTSVVGPEQSYNGGANVNATYAASTATNSAILLAVALDGNLGGSFSATYGGNTMSLLASNSRTAIFAYVPADTTAQALSLNTASSSATVSVVYGTITGIDTSSLSVASSNGTSFTSPTSTFNSALTGLTTGDYVLSVFNENGLNLSSTAVTGSTGLSGIYVNTDTFTGGYTSAFLGGTIVGTAYTPSVTYNGTINNTSSGSFGSAVAFTAFTAIPEPSSFALIGGLFALGSVMMRRRHQRVA